MYNSRTFYYMLCNDEIQTNLDMLELFDNIDMLYEDGVIIRLTIEKNQPELLKSCLEYFENKQYPIKDERYKEAHEKLFEILEEEAEETDSFSQINSLISSYTGSDISLLHDVLKSMSLKN